MDIRLVNLKEIPAAIDTLARWHHDQWSYLLPEATLENRIERMQAYLNDDFIPSTWVAVSGKTVMGSAAIVHHDLEIRRELSPWLASVYVGKDFRRQGIAARLVQHVIIKTASQGFDRFYLYTPDQQYLYSTLGWHIRENTVYKGEDISVMEIDLC